MAWHRDPGHKDLFLPKGSLPWGAWGVLLEDDAFQAVPSLDCTGHRELPSSGGPVGWWGDSGDSPVSSLASDQESDLLGWSSPRVYWRGSGQQGTPYYQKVRGTVNSEGGAFVLGVHGVRVDP